VLALSLLIPLEPINSQHDWEYILKRTDFGRHAPALRALQIFSWFGTGCASRKLCAAFVYFSSYTLRSHGLRTSFALASHWLHTRLRLLISFALASLPSHWLALASRWRQRLRTGS